MYKLKKRKKKRMRLSIKERKKRMLKNSEWILLGIFFVGVADLVVKRCDIQWPYLRYAFAVCGVLAFKIAIRVIGFFTRGAMVFLDRIKYM